MLVLSRKNGESIRLGDDIEVTICQVSGHRVRLAISAPRHVSIRRSELDLRAPGPPDEERRRPLSQAADMGDAPVIELVPVPHG
jgi:carbon storage regulator